MTLAVGAFWTLPRIAGVVIVGSAALLAVVSAVVSFRGDVRAAEAMFRDIEVAVGNTSTLRVMALSWGAWTIAVLAGFVVLTVEFWNQNARLIPTLALVGLTVFSLAWVIEAAFHSSVTVWAVTQLELRSEVPPLFAELKKWLNVWLQILVKPSGASFVRRTGRGWDADRWAPVMGRMGGRHLEWIVCLLPFAAGDSTDRLVLRSCPVSNRLDERP